MTSRVYINEIIRYIIVMFFQIFVLKVLPLKYYGVIIVIPMYILMLPINISTTLLLIITFITGFILDVLEFHPGLYTSSLLVIALMKKLWFNLLQSPFEESKILSPAENSISWILMYLAIPILLFEIVYSVELKLSISFEVLSFALIRTLFDYIFSILFVYLLYK